MVNFRVIGDIKSTQSEKDANKTKKLEEHDSRLETHTKIKKIEYSKNILQKTT